MQCLQELLRSGHYFLPTFLVLTYFGSFVKDSIANVEKTSTSGRSMRIGKGPAALLASLLLRNKNHRHAVK